MSEFKTSIAIDKNRLHFSMPISKVDKEKRVVHGFATLDNIDLQGDIVPVEASIKAFESFRGNIREMHQPIAVGKMLSFKPDKFFDKESQKFYNGVFVSAYVSKGAQDTWEKVLDGTLTGFSIGGNIEKSDDIIHSDSDSPIRVIKEFTLSELSLVDSPANQFANIVSIEKGVATGYMATASVENVYWCSKDDVVRISVDRNCDCPQCDGQMQNIGFVESNDLDKSNVIKRLVSETKINFKNTISNNTFIKGNGFYGKVTNVIKSGKARLSSDDIAISASEIDPIAVIQIYSENYGTIKPTSRRVIKNISSLEKVNAISRSEVKEERKMSKNAPSTEDIIVVDEFDDSLTKAVKSGNEDQMEPDPTSAMPVGEKDDKASKATATMPSSPSSPTDMDTEEEDTMETEMNPTADAAEDAAEGEMDDPKKMSAGGKGYNDNLEATKAVVEEIATKLNDALSTLAETVKALDAKIDGVAKSVGVEVDKMKDEFGKRVDAVEKDTAFRKSADLGEIMQEEPQIVEKSLWGGRFLKNADLF